MGKRICVFALSMAMIITMLPMMVFADEENSDFSYYVENEEATITGYNGTDTEIVIPDTIDGYSVTSIGERAFKGSNLTSVTLPDGLTSIGSEAFRECIDIESLTIPDSVTSIGDSAFQECIKITELKLSNNLKSIDEYTFAYCNSLPSISIPGSVETIDMCAFEYCMNLSDVKLFNGLKSIKMQAFSNCSKLTSIEIPDSVEDIESSAFIVCDNLSSVKLSNKMERVNDDTFDHCKNLTEIDFPNSIHTLHGRSFRGTGFTSIVLPENVSDLGDEVFRECMNLETIAIPVSLKKIGEDSFYQCNSLTDVFYQGSESEWEDIKMFTGNDMLLKARIHFNCDDILISLSEEAFVYNGSEQKPTVTVQDADGNLIDSSLYDISFTGNCRDIGQHTVTVIMKDGSGRSASKDFTINPMTAETSMITLAKASYVYTGKAIRPAVSVKDGKTELAEGTDFTVAYSNNKAVGTATVTVTGKGNYTGVTEKATYRINPKGAKIYKPVKGKRAITVRWKKQTAKMNKSRITGYQICLATDKKFTKNKKTVYVKGYNHASRKVRKLKGGKKYYIKIRTYKTVKGTKYYSGWSKVKTATTRK